MITSQDTLITPKPGEHLGPDGLLYCDVCGSKRQTRQTFGDSSRTIRCNCACQDAAYHQLRKAQHLQEERDRIARLHRAATKDTHLQKQTFEASEYDTRGLQLARKYADQWPQSLGLVLWGPPGTGKTYAANCIANALLDQGIPVLITSLGKMLGAMPAVATGNQTSAIDEWMKCSLLILDDLGVERGTPYALEQVYNIIDARYRSGQPMVVTTNLTMEEMENPDSIEKQRIYQRILERCTPVKMDEINIRECKKRENRSAARKLLTGP